MRVMPGPVTLKLKVAVKLMRKKDNLFSMAVIKLNSKYILYMHGDCCDMLMIYRKNLFALMLVIDTT